MSENSTLIHLTLGGEFLNANDLGFLGRAIRSNTTVQQLTLYNSFKQDMEENAVYEFIENLSKNHTLVTINLSSNYIDYSSAQKLRDLIDSNSSLTKLNLTNMHYKAPH